MPVRVTKISICGARGRMGLEIKTLAKQDFRFSLMPDFDLRTKGGVTENPDVIIDFSSAENTSDVAAYCQKHKIALVTGTTGLSSAQVQRVVAASKEIAVFSSPNMSLGLNAMAQALAQFTTVFSAGEIVIEDIHHRYKKDAPSGTAKFLHEIIKQNLKPGASLAEPVSMRGGEVFGIHKVYFFMAGEWVSFEHQALNRAIFGQGALEAAHWIFYQKAGFYQMKDLLLEMKK